jgi:hypothetical protein
MFSTRSYKRKHLRAPLRRNILYEDSGTVNLAKLLNISEGGAFIDYLPIFPEQESFYAFIEVPDYPILQSIDVNTLVDEYESLIKKKIIQIHCNIVRKIENKDDPDVIFNKGLGISFIDLNFDIKEIIVKYTEKSVNNTVFLAKLLEDTAGNLEKIELIKKLTKILGYDTYLEFNELKEVVLNDYQNLQWL